MLEEKIDNNLVSHGPFCDFSTKSGNIVLQIDSEGYFHPDYYLRYRELCPSHFQGSLKDSENKLEKDAANDALKLKEDIKRKILENGDVFRFTSEYLNSIRDEEERMRAYQGLTVTSAVLYGEDAEIEKDPFKYLNISRDVSFGEVRAAWMNLAKEWHPDYIAPLDPEKIRQFFGNNPYFLDDGHNIESWVNMMKKAVSSNNYFQEMLNGEKLSEGKKPCLETLSAEDLEKLSPEKQQEYYKEHRAYEIIQNTVSRIRNEMESEANKKMTIINRAFKAAKKFYSNIETENLGGFNWCLGQKRFGNLVDWITTYSEILLEGDGAIRKNEITSVDGLESKINSKKDIWSKAYLCYDMGQAPLATIFDYRQRAHLQSFFAWMELRQGKELSPFLLADISDSYNLNKDQAEQLRLMVMNKESPNFIINVLNISEDNKMHLLGVLDDMLNGPSYYANMLANDERSYNLGVELTQQGGMILTYKKQGNDNFFDLEKTQSHFTPADVNMMTAVAYGPLLQEIDK